MNTEIDLQRVVEIIEKVNQTGLENFSGNDLSDVNIFANLYDHDKLNINLLSDENNDVSYDELITRYLYLQCTLDQGPDMEGIRLLLRDTTNDLYQKEWIFLHDPNYFFQNLNEIIEIIDRTHENIRNIRQEETGLRSYSLLDQTRINPTVLFRWGTPLSIINKLKNNSSTLLEWINSWKYSDRVVDYLRNDLNYGLGKAIGDKASRLFIKFLLHNFKIINKNSPKWNSYSYQIPLDSNVGRVLMRSGYVFFFIDEERFISSCCRKQKNNKINLGANRLRNESIDDENEMASSCIKLIKSWNSRLGSIKFPITLNAFSKILNSSGIESSIGIIDDGLIKIGVNYCKNENPECSSCPLKELCIANNQEIKLKEIFYCGTGEGIFY